MHLTSLALGVDFGLCLAVRFDQVKIQATLNLERHMTLGDLTTTQKAALHVHRVVDSPCVLGGDGHCSNKTQQSNSPTVPTTSLLPSNVTSPVWPRPRVCVMAVGSCCQCEVDGVYDAW